MRVILFGLGPIGAAIGRLALEKPGVKVVAAIDGDPAKVGQDAGRVIGLDRDLGVKVVASLEEGLKVDADAVFHCTGSYLERVSDQLFTILAAGKNIVSTCEELSYPHHKHVELTRKLDEAAKAAGKTVHGTGVNPGFVMDKLPITLSGACQRVDSVDVLRIVDAGRRRLPLQKKVGAGMTPEEFAAQVAAGVIKHHGLPESAAMIADALGLPIGELTEVIEPVIATAKVTTEYLTVEAGQVAGVKQVCTDSKNLVRLELQMYVGAPDPADKTSIKGLPDLSMVIPGGTHGDVATAAAAVNALPLVVAAPAGLVTVMDLPVRYMAAEKQPVHA